MAVFAILLMQTPLKGSSARYFFMLISLFMTARYVMWRLTETLPTAGWLELSLAVLLLGAEMFGIVLFLLGLFTLLRPLERTPVALPSDGSKLPTVDVFVPTYNESWELVEPTLLAAKQMRYPDASKVTVWCCDDGATEARLASPDPEVRRKAEERRDQFRAGCEVIGVRYRTRADNSKAKAGNLNAALLESEGDLVVVFDADHVPAFDFLERTVGPFLKDERLALVQTPHFFISPDPVEKNLGVFRRMPGESELFYGQVQPGLDYWNAAFFCGSAAVLRRQALSENRGFEGDTVTEDAETSLALHANGWNSIYINRPMIAGLHPHSFSDFVRQRIRWAQGMVQLFLLKNPMFKGGLNMAQRLCYTASSAFWFFALPRVVFILMPPVILLTGLNIFDASVTEFVLYALPHVLCAMALSEFLSGRYRWPLISELYELALSFFILPAIIMVFLSPRKPRFNVTSKEVSARGAYRSSLAWPFYLAMGLIVLALVNGAFSIALGTAREGDVVIMVWNLLNLIVLLGAYAVTWENRQFRTMPRVPLDIPARLEWAGGHADVFVRDASTRGAGLDLGWRVGPTDGSPVALKVQIAGRGELTLPAAVSGQRRYGQNLVMGVAWSGGDIEQRKAVVAMIYADSEVWRRELDRRQRRMGLFGGLGYFAGLALVRATRAFFRVGDGR